MRAVSSFEEYFAHIKSLLNSARNDTVLFNKIVNAPFHNKLHSTTLDLGMIVLVLTNTKTRMIDRIAYSDTNHACNAINASPIKFEDIKIPLNSKVNITAKAIRAAKSYTTSDWYYLLTPMLSAEAARFNQAESGMGCSVVQPLTGARDGGALIFSFYQTIDVIGEDHHAFMKRYADLVVLHLNNTA